MIEWSRSNTSAMSSSPPFKPKPTKYAIGNVRSRRTTQGGPEKAGGGNATKVGGSEAKLQAEIESREDELLQSKRELEAKEKDRQELQEKIAAETEAQSKSKSPCSDMCCYM
jgi:Skp family chaperone for outer membrane proteins